ncbi:DNRLRE domain-containing protein [Streptomyces sp. NPDC002870]|uniref:DNRLRE domain-containing protein n=1 Tax=Streptomyces sp. NPDC002870 TaxID=3364666 RepID=UPI00367EBB0E
MLLTAEAAVTAMTTGQALALPSRSTQTTALSTGRAAAVPSGSTQAAESSTPSGPAQSPDEASARVMARVQDRRIEILDARTEDTTSWVNPDGTVSVESFTGPIRVKDSHDKWQPVDVTLAEVDGKVVPKAAAADIAFSAGGSKTPLAQVTRGEKTLGVAWDGTLPAPVLKGNTATYPGAVPGGDVVVTALPEGFSHSVILHQRPDGPVEFRLPIMAEGLTLKETADERLRWDDSKGKQVAAAPPPLMWDASEEAKSQDPEHAEIVNAVVDNAADGGQVLVLKPSAEFLSDPDVTYPVVIDPTNTLAGPTTDTWIQDSDYPTSQRGSTELKAGTYDGVQKARSYLKFDVTEYSGKKIVDTDLRLYSYYSSTCSASGSGVQVRRITSAWDPAAISWSAQPSTTATGAVTSTAAKGYNSSCPAGHVSWDVDTIVQDWADGQANHGIRLAAVNETDTLTWRRYRSANYVDGSHDPDDEPSLTVTYNSYPALPTSPAISPSVLNAYNGKRYVTTLTPQLSAKISDADGGTVKAQFEITPDPAYNDTTYTYTGTTSSVASGSTASLTIPSANAFPAGTHLRYRVRGYDGSLYGSWNGYTAFVLNTGKPAAPSISCSPYAKDTWTAKATGGAQCTFDTSSTDGQGYYWGLNDPNTPTRIDDATDGNGGDPLTVTVNPGDGWHTLYAKTVDSGGNLSTTATAYKFGVGADGAALLAPGDGDRPARRVALAATGKPTYTGVTYQYRRGETDAWKNVPLGDVTKNSDGSPVTSWPLAAPNGAPPALVWNITTTFAEDGPIDVRAAFTDGTTTGYSPANTVIIDRNAGTAPSEDVGPGQVNHLTGDYLLSATDASAFGLSVSRIASSRRPTAGADAEGQVAIFGPQWTSGTMAEASESIWAYVRKTSATSVAITDAHGAQIGFTATSAGGWKAEPGSEKLTLTGSLTGSFTLQETDGTKTTFAKIDADATTWQAATTFRASDNTTTTVVSEKVVSGSNTLARPKLVIAPTSAVSASTCAATPSTRGCRLLEFVYATSTTATDSAFGDVAGQVQEIRLWSTAPGDSTATSKAVQMYLYDAAGRLRHVWNPQISPSLKTAYSYDTANRVIALTPPGELPWTFTYGKAGNAATAGNGMLLKASRPSLTPGSKTETNGTATTSVVYDVPLTGTNAPYAMGASHVAAWGQTDLPTDATAVFPADAVPASNDGAALTASSYTRASISYIDASGRQVNTASPGEHIGTAEFDRFGNVVRELSASNRELALATSGAALDELTRLGLNILPTAHRAQQLSTTFAYSADGQRQMEEYGPLHLVILEKQLAAGAGGTSLPAGTEVPARKHTVNTYDQGRPTDGSATVSGLITSTRVGAYVDGYPTDADVRTTATTHDWTKGLETSTIDDPNGLRITKQTAYDASGRVIKTVKPMSSGTDAGTTVTTYWSATGTGACNGRTEWADLVCSVGPAGTITGSGSNPNQLPTQTTEYDRWGNPAKVTRTANGSTATTTTTYDSAARAVRISVAGGGDAVSDIITTYDDKTGKVATVTSGGHTVTHAYDDLGREVGYNDGAGNAATREYDALNRLTKVSDSAPSTTTYAYDTAKDSRGIATSVTDAEAGTFSGTYDADGNLKTGTLPGGYQLTTTRDATGAETARSYTDTSDQSVPLADNAAYTVHGNTGARNHTTGVTVGTTFQYDAAGRATRADTENDTSCIRKANEYNSNSSLIKQTTFQADCASIDTAQGDAETFAFDSADRPIDSGYSYDAFSRWLTRPDGTTQKYFANDLASQETTGGNRQSWTLDAEGRPASWTTEQQNQDSTWSLVDTTTSHYAEEGGQPSWVESAAGITRNIQDLEERVAVTTTSGSEVLQLTNLDGDAAVRIPLASAPTGIGTMSAVGSVSLGSFGYDFNGLSISIPIGCWWTHSINGRGKYINWEIAGVDCYGPGVFSRFCNTRIDFSYANTNNTTYRTSRGRTHYTCYWSHVPVRHAPGKRTLPYYGKACAKLYINGSRRAVQCHFIAK